MGQGASVENVENRLEHTKNIGSVDGNAPGGFLDNAQYMCILFYVYLKRVRSMCILMSTHTF